MMNRNENFDTGLSEKLLKNRKFRQEHMFNLVNKKGKSIEEALVTIIQTMGQTEFSELTKSPKQYICDFVNDRRKPKRETLEHYLKPFGLKVRMSVEKH